MKVPFGKTKGISNNLIVNVHVKLSVGTALLIIALTLNTWKAF